MSRDPLGQLAGPEREQLARALHAERGLVLLVGGRGPLEQACLACAAALADAGRAVTWAGAEPAPAGVRRVGLDPARGVFPAEAIARARAEEGAVVALLVDRSSAEAAARAASERLFVAGLYGVEGGEALARLAELAGRPLEPLALLSLPLPLE